MRRFNFVFIFLVLAEILCAQNNLRIKEASSIDAGEPKVIDADYFLEKFYKANGININTIAQEKPILQKATAWSFVEGSTYTWWAADYVAQQYYQVPATCKRVGTNCYIFVEDSSWAKDRLDDVALDAIKNAFDNSTPANPSKGIYQTNIDNFGNVPNVDSDPKIIILILNIRDGYNPVTSQGYTAGYFTGTNETNDSHSNRAEIYYMDCYPAKLMTASGRASSLSTCAHEFQHMIHWNYHGSNQERFFNEGCSQVASLINGYNVDLGSYTNFTNKYLLSWNLNDDNDVLNDYSRASRFFLYLKEQFWQNDNTFFKKFVQSSRLGVDAFNNDVFPTITPATARRFDDIVEDWWIANYINDITVNPKWGYTYSGVSKVTSKLVNEANRSNYADGVYKEAVQYFTYINGQNLNLTSFTSSNSNLKIKAIKIGTSGKRVDDVTPPFTISDFGITYPEVTLMIYHNNRSESSTGPFNYTYSSTYSPFSIPSDIIYVPGSITYYTFSSGGTGYVTGTNSLKVKGLYERFDITGTAPVKEIRYYFGARTVTGAADNVNFVIRSSSNGVPAAGTPLYSSTASTQTFNLPTTTAQATRITVTPQVNVSNSFFVGVEWDPNMDDTFVLFSSKNGDGAGMRRTWWQRSDNTYAFIGDTFSGGFDVDLAIGVKLDVPNDVNEVDSKIPAVYNLSQNYPNPFNPETLISYQLPSAGFVSLKVFDLLGREVATLVNEYQQAGKYNSQFSIRYSQFSSGIYFYTLRAGNFIETKKMILMK